MAGKKIAIRGAFRAYGRGFKLGQEKELKEYLKSLTPEQRRNAVAHAVQTGAVEGLEGEIDDQVLADATLLASAAGEIKDEQLGQGNADTSVPAELQPPAPPTASEEQEAAAASDRSTSSRGGSRRGG